MYVSWCFANRVDISYRELDGSCRCCTSVLPMLSFVLVSESTMTVYEMNLVSSSWLVHARSVSMEPGLVGRRFRHPRRQPGSLVGTVMRLQVDTASKLAHIFNIILNDKQSILVGVDRKVATPCPCRYRGCENSLHDMCHTCCSCDYVSAVFCLLQTLYRLAPSPIAVQSMAIWGGTGVIGALWLVQVGHGMNDCTDWVLGSAP